MKRVLHREMADVYVGGRPPAHKDPQAQRQPHYRSCQDERPNCFIFRQSVTVLMLSASAALRRFPPNRSSARSMEARSCSCRSSVSSPGRRRDFCVTSGGRSRTANAGGVGQDDRPLDGVLQLTNVAGPSIVHQRRHRVGRDGPDVLLHPRRRADQETVHQRRDVLPPLAQRRHRR